MILTYSTTHLKDVQRICNSCYGCAFENTDFSCFNFTRLHNLNCEELGVIWNKTRPPKVVVQEESKEDLKTAKNEQYEQQSLFG